MAKMGRPKKPIDWTQFDKMAAIHCTQQEIASMFSMTIETLNERCKEENGKTFLEHYTEKSANGKMSIRRRQYELAMKGNVVMLIWVGKNWLGQTDKKELRHMGTENDDDKLVITFKKDKAPEPAE